MVSNINRLRDMIVVEEKLKGELKTAKQDLRFIQSILSTYVGTSSTLKITDYKKQI